MKMTEHTPTPWKYYSGSHSIYGQRPDGAEEAVCVVSGPRKPGRQDHNAAFILRACNSYDKLRETLAFFASVIKSGEPWTETCQQEYDAALKLAEDAK
jgi:hypothetical protein